MSLKIGPLGDNQPKELKKTDADSLKKSDKDVFTEYKESISKDFETYKTKVNNAFQDYKNGNIHEEADSGKMYTPKYDSLEVIDHPPVYYKEPIDKKTKEGFIKEMRKPENWKPVKSEEPLKSEPVSQNGKPKIIDFIDGISEDTKTYLNSDKQFLGYQDELMGKEKHILEQKTILQEKHKELLAAKAKFDDIPYSNYDEKASAEEEYRITMSAYEAVKGDIYGTAKDAEKMTENLLSYVSVINNWKDGTITDYNLQGTGNVFVKMQFKSVTLPDGRKAYEADGKYYALRSDGMPDPEKIIE